MDVLPLMNAAGTVKSEVEAVRFLALPVPGVLLGSFTLGERSGNAGTTFFAAPGLGSVNSLGLPGPAVDEWVKIVASVRHRTTDASKELWVSVAGFSASEFAPLVHAALSAGADHIELNLGCPNVIESGQRKPIASYSPEAVHSSVECAVEAFGRPSHARLGVKLSPILDPALLEEVCAAIRDFEAISFVTSMNTVPNCLALDQGKPAISVLDGLAGMGGPAVKWIALGQLHQLGALLGSNIELVGVGGITEGQDVVDYLALKGVRRCQVGTAVWRAGPDALLRIGQEYAEALP